MTGGPRSCHKQAFCVARECICGCLPGRFLPAHPHGAHKVLRKVGEVTEKSEGDERSGARRATFDFRIAVERSSSAQSPPVLTPLRCISGFSSVFSKPCVSNPESFRRPGVSFHLRRRAVVLGGKESRFLKFSEPFHFQGVSLHTWSSSSSFRTRKSWSRQSNF